MHRYYLVSILLIALIATATHAQTLANDYKAIDAAAGKLSDGIYQYLTLRTGGKLGPKLEEIKMGGGNCNDQPKACTLYNQINNIRHRLSEKMRADCGNGENLSSTDCKNSIAYAKQQLDAFNAGYLALYRAEGSKPNGPPAPMSAGTLSAPKVVTPKPR